VKVESNRGIAIFMDLKIGLSDHVRAAMNLLEAENAVNTGLPRALEDAEALLKSLPAHADVSFVSSHAVPDLGPDFLTGMATIFAHSEARLSVLFFVCCYRLMDLLEIVVDGLNRGRFSRTMLAARSLVEHSAICRWRQRELHPLLEAVEAIRPSSLRKCKGNAELTLAIGNTILTANRKLEEIYGAGRFNRDVFADLNKIMEIELEVNARHRQVGVMDAIDDLEWLGPLIPATTPRFYYELLCDYVHPNVGSNFLYVNREDYTDMMHLESGSMNRLVHMQMAVDSSDTSSLYLHVLSVLIIPVREAIGDMIKHARWLEAKLDNRREFQRRLKEIGVTGLLS
jgi:hypothetical protein